MARRLALVGEDSAGETTRQPRRFGSVRRMKSGRWQARYQCPSCDATHPAHTTFDTEAVALDYLDGIRSDIQRDRYVCLVVRKRETEAQQRALSAEKAAQVSFGDYAQQWLERRSERLKPRTVMLYRRQLEADLLPSLADVPLPALDVETVDQWWDQLCVEHPQRKTGNAHVYGLLKTIMNGALRDRKQPRVTTNPCQVESEELTRPRRKQNDPATPAELQTIADAMPERLALAVWLAAYSGLRFGELAELRRRDVDMTGPEPALSVTRAVVHREGRTIVGEPKTRPACGWCTCRGSSASDWLTTSRSMRSRARTGLLFTGPRTRSRCGCGYPNCQGGHLLNSTLHRPTTRRERPRPGPTCGGTTCGTPG